MDLLTKFENIHVDAAARISPEDAAYCASEQKSYEKAHTLYTTFRELLQEAIKSEELEWEERTGKKHSAYRCHTYCENHGDGGLDAIDKRISEIQRNFIQSLLSHFIEKYRISLDNYRIFKHLGQEKPRYETSISNEQWDNILEEHRLNSSRPLHHNQIIDEILLQMDGLTFVDKAVQEIKDNARYSSNGKYTIDKKVIRFADGFSYGYPEHSHVLLAVWHYNTGSTSMINSYWNKALNLSHIRSGEDSRVGTPYEFDGHKACKLRYYKSGRWDVTFASNEYASTFAREYLGY